MAHIHLEDGAFALQWTILWWCLAAALVGLCIFTLRKRGILDSRSVTVAGLCTAATFAVFQVNIPLFGGVHINLTPLIGILAGPYFGGVVVLILNILSASIGHGGWGLIGANVVVNLTEVVSAYLIFRFASGRIAGTFTSAGIAALGSLILGNAALVAIIMISGVQGVTQSRSDMLYSLSLIAGVNMVVAVIEAMVTGYLVSFIQRVKPEMLIGSGRYDRVI